MFLWTDIDLVGCTVLDVEIQCSVQFSSVAQLCLALCDPMDCSTPGFPVYHQVPELAQTHVHPVGDAIQPSHHLRLVFQIWDLLTWWHQRLCSSSLGSFAIICARLKPIWPVLSSCSKIHLVIHPSESSILKWRQTFFRWDSSFTFTLVRGFFIVKEREEGNEISRLYMQKTSMSF